MNIYSILSSKPHNPHYLDKYVRFIAACQQQNINYTGYAERHHICPKAKDMFPEYASFKIHSWNCATLTARQHFIAHMMLWKVYNNQSMTFSAYYLKKIKNQKINSKMYEILKIKRLKFLSEYFQDVNKGLVNIKDTHGNIKKITIEEFNSGEYKGQHAETVVVTDGNKSFRVPYNDPRYLSGELVGHTIGMTYALDNNGVGHYVEKNDPRFATGEFKGNNAGKIYITDGNKNKRVNHNAKIPNGWKVGRTLKNSPKGSIWITNGCESKMIHSHDIPQGWKKGRSLCR